MIFGIIWELVLRQLASIESQESFPRFNSRVFFYLFLPSTVLESAGLLSNKWLYLNLLPILVHSIFGTLFYAASLGFTIYSLSRQNIFNLNLRQTAPMYSQTSLIYNLSNQSSLNNYVEPKSNNISLLYSETSEWPFVELSPLNYDKGYVTVGSSVELNNLTLADCLVFGTILSSIDSTTILGIFRLFQVNDKLYYLTLGENLMNNAVVLVIFNLLLDFFNETRLTVVKIYIAIIRFFITLIGSVFLGFLVAGVALVAVRITKRFRVPCALTSYQNQCQAMVETLLILKLAYLTYTLAGLAGTSSIVSLATFGILQDQYIKHNLNLRSQLTFRQVVLATKTMGFSLVYPLLGMLLVEVADTSQFFQTWRSFASGSNEITTSNTLNIQVSDVAPTSTLTAASVAASKITHLANQANLYWNFKFLSLLTLVTVTYRFIWVVSLSHLCNLFSSSQLKIKFKEQILVAYGGLKGPLAFALVHRLIEHEEYRDRTMRNKHLFIYTILFISFVSTILKGSFIRPLVAKMQHSLCHNQHLHTLVEPPSISGDGNIAHHESVVFNEINCKVAEYVAHGLNSVLGYTKSPYDRLVELNETHIKPWLTRDGSNTNWLSVFYDSLILDETLNDTCFYRSSAAVLQSYWHLSTRHRRPSNQRWRAVKGFLDTIDEHADQANIVAPPNEQNLVPIEGSMSNKLKQQAHQIAHKRVVTSRNQTTGRRRISPIDRQLADTSTAQNSILKEYVMFNLKLEDAKRRKQSSLTRRLWSSKVEPASKRDCESSDWAEQQSISKCTRMLSTTSSGDRQSDGPLEWTKHDKHRHLIKVERHLLALDPDELAGSTRPTDENYQSSQQRQGTPARAVAGKFRVRQPAPQKRQVIRLKRGKTRAHEQQERGQIQVSQQNRDPGKPVAEGRQRRRPRANYADKTNYIE